MLTSPQIATGVALALLGAITLNAVQILTGGSRSWTAQAENRFHSSALRVIDGDTVAMGNEHYRLANHDAPEIRHPNCLSCKQPMCQREEAVGMLAKQRLYELTRGNLSLAFVRCANGEDRDNYGRYCIVIRVEHNGAWRDVGDILIAEGLAVRYPGMKKDWCKL